MRRLALHLLVLAAPVAVGAGRARLSFGEQLAAAYADPALSRATMSAQAVSLATGEVVWEAEPDALLVPASTVKLVTAMALLDARLDLEARIETRVVATAPIVDGVIDGDLVVVGEGDPSLGLGAVEDWVADLRARGVTEVTGDVVADAGRFGPPALGSGWMWDDATTYFSAPVTALAWEGNVARVTVTPGEVGATVVIEAHPCVPLVVEAVTVDGEGELVVERPPGEPTRVRGTLPVGPAERVVVTIPDPPACVALALRGALDQAGITVRGAARRQDLAGDPVGEVVAEHASATFRELLGHMLVHSDNLYAESLARRLDPAARGWTFEGARPGYAALLGAAGVPAGGWRLADGSGLSRYDLLAADTLVALLRYGWARPWRDDLLQLLPSGGEGTLGSRLVGGPAERAVHAKTGSMTGVFNIAGYVVADGEPLAFALLSNGVTEGGAAPRAAQDAVLHLLAQRPPEPPRAGCVRAR